MEQGVIEGNISKLKYQLKNQNQNQILKQNVSEVVDCIKKSNKCVCRECSIT